MFGKIFPELDKVHNFRKQYNLTKSVADLRLEEMWHGWNYWLEWRPKAREARVYILLASHHSGEIDQHHDQTDHAHDHLVKSFMAREDSFQGLPGHHLLHLPLSNLMTSSNSSTNYTSRWPIKEHSAGSVERHILSAICLSIPMLAVWIQKGKHSLFFLWDGVCLTAGVKEAHTYTSSQGKRDSSGRCQNAGGSLSD